MTSNYLASSSNSEIERGRLMEMISCLRQNIIKPNSASSEEQSVIRSKIPIYNGLKGGNLTTVSGLTIDRSRISAIESLIDAGFDISHSSPKRIKLDLNGEEREELQNTNVSSKIAQSYGQDFLEGDLSLNPYHITKNVKGDWILYYQDYEYSLFQPGYKLWKCAWVPECPARCTIDGPSINLIKPHTHAPVTEKSVFKQKAENTTPISIMAKIDKDQDCTDSNMTALIFHTNGNDESDTEAESLWHGPPVKISTGKDLSPQNTPDTLIPATTYQDKCSIKSDPCEDTPFSPHPSTDFSITSDRSLMQLWNTLVQDNGLIRNHHSPQNRKQNDVIAYDVSEQVAISPNSSQSNQNLIVSEVDEQGTQLSTGDFFAQFMSNFTSTSVSNSAKVIRPHSKLDSSVEKLYLRRQSNNVDKVSPNPLITSENFKYFLTLKGNKLLVHEDYIYRIRQEGSKRWRCIEKSCPGKAMVNANLVYITHGHNHPPDLDKTQKKGALSDLVCGVLECDDITQVDQLYGRYTSSLPVSFIGFLPTLASLRQLHRQIKKSTSNEPCATSPSTNGEREDLSVILNSCQPIAPMHINNETNGQGSSNTRFVATLNGNLLTIKQNLEPSNDLKDANYAAFNECRVSTQNFYQNQISALSKGSYNTPDTVKSFKEGMINSVEAPQCKKETDFGAVLVNTPQGLCLMPTLDHKKHILWQINGVAPTTANKQISSQTSEDSELNHSVTWKVDVSARNGDITLDEDNSLLRSHSPIPNASDYHPEKCRFIRNLQGHSQVVHCDFNYRLRSEGVNRWRCVESGCRGKCSVYGDAIVVTCGHDHPPYPEKVRKKEILGSILSRACESRHLSPDDIITEVTRDLAPETLVYLPHALVIKQMIERARSSEYGPNHLAIKRDRIFTTKAQAWRVIKSSSNQKAPKPIIKQHQGTSNTPPPIVDNSGTPTNDLGYLHEFDGSQLPYKFIMGLKGSKQIVYQGYNYRMRVPSKNRWRCVEAGCLGGCYVEGPMIQITQEHNHGPKEDKIARKEVLGDLVYRAVVTEPDTDPEILIDQVTTRLPPSVRSSLPSFTSLKQLIARTRSSSIIPTPNHTTFYESLNGPSFATCIVKSKETDDEHSPTTTKVNYDGSEEPIKYFLSRRGHCHVIFQGYVYRLRKQGKKVWRCVKSKICRGKCIINGNQIALTSEHSHPPLNEVEQLGLPTTQDIKLNGFHSPFQGTKFDESPKEVADGDAAIVPSNHSVHHQSLVNGDINRSSLNATSKSLDDMALGENYLVSNDKHESTSKYLYLLGFVLALEYDLTTRSHYNPQSRTHELASDDQLKRMQAYSKPLHTRLKHRCFRCSFKSESETVLDEHQRKPHWKHINFKGLNSQPLLYCPYCSFVSQWVPLMCEHLKVQHNLTPPTTPVIDPVPRAFMCPRCPYEVDIKKNWAQHLEKCLSKKGKSTNILSPRENFSAYFPLLPNIKVTGDRSLLTLVREDVLKDLKIQGSMEKSQSASCDGAPLSNYDSNLKPLSTSNNNKELNSEGSTELRSNLLNPTTLDPTVENDFNKFNLCLDDVQLMARLNDQDQNINETLQTPLGHLKNFTTQEIDHKGTSSPPSPTTAIGMSGLASAHFLLTTHHDRLKLGLKRLMKRFEKGQVHEDQVDSLNNLDYYLDYLIPNTIYDLLKDAIQDDADV